MNISTFSIFKIFRYISKKRIKQLQIALILMILSGIGELIVINSVVPFIASITNPQLLLDLKISKVFSNIFGLETNIANPYPFIIFFAISIVLSTFLRISTIWFINKVSAMVGHDLSIRTFSNNISQPYEYHLKDSSSNLIIQNTTYVENVGASLIGFLNLIYNFILSILISVGLIYITPALTSYSIIIFGTIYLILGKTFKKYLRDSSKERALSAQLKIKTLNESFGSIRNLILESNHRIYINKFRMYDLNTRLIAIKTSIISSSPKFIIECIALLSIIIASLFLMSDANNNSSIIVALGTFALGMQKLLPAFQGVYAQINQIRFFSSDLEKTMKYLEIKVENDLNPKTTPMKFKKSIRLDSIYFSYDLEKYVIENFNLEIFKGEKIGIIGKTGSGKTTISDLIMGLLKPTKGLIYVDDKNIYDQNYPNRIKNWRSSISHVPQDIFLSDTTIAENIALGIDKNLISFKKLKECAKKAQIHEFIESTKDGYFTKVGERGVRLSGGQSQRIAIARALYRNSEILVFDEATSALDKNTELELMSAINSLSNELTIISIAHNHSTLKDYDRIIKVEKGKIFETGKDQLII